MAVAIASLPIHSQYPITHTTQHTICRAGKGTTKHTSQQEFVYTFECIRKDAARVTRRSSAPVEISLQCSRCGTRPKSTGGAAHLDPPPPSVCLWSILLFVSYPPPSPPRVVVGSAATLQTEAKADLRRETPTPTHETQTEEEERNTNENEYTTKRRTPHDEHMCVRCLVRSVSVCLMISAWRLFPFLIFPSSLQIRSRIPLPPRSRSASQGRE